MDPVYSISLILGSGVLIGSVVLWNFRYLFLQMLVEPGFIYYVVHGTDFSVCVYIKSHILLSPYIEIT